MRAYNDLRKAAVARRVNALFRAMDSDVLLQSQFVTDPSQVISEYVNSMRLEPQSAIEINHLIYSIMVNRELLEWLHSYAVQKTEELPTVSRFLQDFSRAVAEHNAYYVVLSLLLSSSKTQAVLNRENLETIVPVLLRIAQLTFSGTGQGNGNGTNGITSLTISETQWDFNTKLTSEISSYVTRSLEALSEFAQQMVDAGILEMTEED